MFALKTFFVFFFPPLLPLRLSSSIWQPRISGTPSLLNPRWGQEEPKQKKGKNAKKGGKRLRDHGQNEEPQSRRTRNPIYAHGILLAASHPPATSTFSFSSSFLLLLLPLFFFFLFFLLLLLLLLLLVLLYVPPLLSFQGGGDFPSMNWATMGWGYWEKPYVPNVGVFKWMDARRMTNVCNRWAQNHTDDLQQAWFNGIGFESWENVWGTWNEIVPADGEAVRRVATLMRFFGTHGYLTSQTWEPHFPVLQYPNIFARSQEQEEEEEEQEEEEKE